MKIPFKSILIYWIKSPSVPLSQRGRQQAFKFLTVIFLLLLSAVGLRAQYAPDTWVAGLITGGSVTSSCANTLGELGHFSFGINGMVSSDPYENVSLTTGSMAGVLRLGLFGGGTLGPSVHGILSLDAFARMGQLSFNGSGSDGATFWGLGGRLGILRNSILTPAVSVSLGHHETGDVTLAERIFGPVIPARKKVSVTSLRLDVSKNLFVFTPYAGLGVNKVEVDNQTVLSSDLDETESVFYGGVEWNLMVLHIGAEVMRTAGENFGTLGIRVAF